MKKLLFYLTFSVLINCSQNLERNEFILDGSLDGNHTGEIIFAYTDFQNNYIKDTLAIKDGKFFAKGKIDGDTQGLVYVDSRSIDDKNYVSFFIAPNENRILLTWNKFKEANISGSRTQKEYEKLKKRFQPIADKQTQLVLERKNLLEKIGNGEANPEALQKQLEILQSELIKNGNEVKEKTLGFVFENPNSYLAAFNLVKFYVGDFSADSLAFFYDRMDAKVKDGIYGKELKTIIEKRKTVSEVGSKAPNFVLEGLHGNSINLSSFKGKYVLLDFWASWCGPCRKQNPNMIALYNKYQGPNFEIIGLSGDHNKEEWKQAITKDGIDHWPQAFMGKGRIGIISEYRTTAYPSYILIDKQGVIVERYSGASVDGLVFDDLAVKIEKLIK